MAKRELLLGDEALALGALHAGLSGVYAYPGTPSTEITEYIQQHPLAAQRNVHRTWSSNEKTAMEEALGMSFAGQRALVCMKHVGLNVAADAFVNSAMTGANGGLVVVAADDPSMHSSQNEQDSRFYGKFALVPTFEPADQQEAYDMAKAAFDLSERFRIPVLMRLTTRMAHSRAVVETGEARAENPLSHPEQPRQWVLMPGNSRVRYQTLLEDYARLEEESAASPFNAYTEGPDKRLGIVACGIAHNYLMENYPDGCPHPVLKIAQYPLPRTLVRRIAAECGTLLILEEGQPVVEEIVRGVLPNPVAIRGRLTGELPRTGELTPDSVRAALGMAPRRTHAASGIVVPRPPALCQGCGHRDMYTALTEVIREEYPAGKVFSDIGCYTLGWLAPLHAIDTCVDMGASITMAKGAADAGQHPSVAVIGDSTFTHSGMTGLLDAVNERADITVIISDNLTTGMTGGQDSAGTGRLEQICAGIGVDPAHIRTVVPLPKNREEMKAVIREEIAHRGVSVIIPRRECIQTAKRHNAAKKLRLMKRDIILSGVGGQGILSIAAVIGRAALEDGLHIKQAEVHGMSQRGGDVQSNLRISSSAIRSDLIPRGAADLIVSMEPMAALRYLPWLADDGWVITGITPLINIPNYPEGEALRREREKLPHAVVLDADAVANAAMAPRSANMALLGAAAPLLGIDAAKLESGIRAIFARKGGQVVETNLAAFRAGYEATQKQAKP